MCNHTFLYFINNKVRVKSLKASSGIYVIVEVAAQNFGNGLEGSKKDFVYSVPNYWYIKI